MSRTVRKPEVGVNGRSGRSGGMASPTAGSPCGRTLRSQLNHAGNPRVSLMTVENASVNVAGAGVAGPDG
jgi:hypothetical protein